MTTDLRKLAESLRRLAANVKIDHSKKCASITVAAIGLEALKRKIYG